jgi:hypothetical protein
MKTLNAVQLAWVMQIPRKEAEGKLQLALAKGAKNESDDDDKPAIKTEALGHILGIDFEFFIKDIKKNFLKNPATGSYIINYPSGKLKPSKKTGLYPKTLSIPSMLRGFLSKETQDAIKDKWREKYAKEIDEHNITVK